jgi:hypothetical protein
MHMPVKALVRRTAPVTRDREEELFRRARDIADALKEIPEVSATEYRAGPGGIRVIFAISDQHAGDLIRRIIEKFRITPAIADTGYRLSIYDVDDTHVLIALDAEERFADAVRDAVRGIRKC